MSTIHLPIQSTSFVGRQSEINEMLDLLSQDACRLVTILGTGGMGKTRLAIAVAEKLVDDYSDGVYFVDLAPLKLTEAIITTTASVLGLNFQQVDLAPFEQILYFLREKIYYSFSIITSIYLIVRNWLMNI